MTTITYAPKSSAARKPTQEETDALLLKIADRLDSQAQRYEMKGTVSTHDKIGLTCYMKNEAANIRSFVKREKRLMDAYDKVQS